VQRCGRLGCCSCYRKVKQKITKIAFEGKGAGTGCLAPINRCLIGIPTLRTRLAILQDSSQLARRSLGYVSCRMRCHCCMMYIDIVRHRKHRESMSGSLDLDSTDKHTVHIP
jgi:hypothetical protein